MIWINFLHFYQPVNVDASIIKEATEKSYLRIIRALEEHADIKFTVNINGSLLIRWEELGYQDLISKIVKKAGYEWLILDEMAWNGKLAEADTEKVYKDRNSGIKIVLRSRAVSKEYVPNAINKLINIKGEEEKIISATDGELYGLRYIDHTAEFEKLLKNSKLKTMTVSEFIDSQKEFLDISPAPHSWETTEKEFSQGQPFNLWQEKTNTIHKKIWKLLGLAYETIEENEKDLNYWWARWHLVRGMASCTFWWASARDFRSFSSLFWSPDEIERGINELIRAVRTLDGENTRDAKIKAEKLYVEIEKMVWQKHWVYYWKKT